MKTIKLGDRPRGDRQERLGDILTGALLIGILLFARQSLNGPHIASGTISQPTALPPIIIIATAPAVIVPTAVPVPTSAPEVIFITLPTPAPEVIYVQSPPEVVYVEAPAVATPEPVSIVNEPELQTIAVPPDEELSPALLREAMDR